MKEGKTSTKGNNDPKKPARETQVRLPPIPRRFLPQAFLGTSAVRRTGLPRKRRAAGCGGLTSPSAAAPSPPRRTGPDGVGARGAFRGSGVENRL